MESLGGGRARLRSPAATIQKAVEKRIGRLPEDLRDVLAVASVIRHQLRRARPASLVQARDVDDAIDRLVEQGLIEEERESRGDLLSSRAASCATCSTPGCRPAGADRFIAARAELLETRHAGRIERVLPQLVHHFSQGDVPDKTVEYALAPGEDLARGLQRRRRRPLGHDRL